MPFPNRGENLKLRNDLLSGRMVEPISMNTAALIFKEWAGS